MILTMITQSLMGLKRDFWGTFAAWQNKRPLWRFIGCSALFLELFSWAFFQNYLGLKPCELCVYIRFAMIGLFIGAMAGVVNPRILVLKLFAYAASAWWIIQGLIWNYQLHMENIQAASSEFMGICADTSLRFPLGLKLNLWLPSHFQPKGLCGVDSNWAFMGLTMPEWLFFVYGAYVLLITCMAAAWVRDMLKRRG